MAKASWSEGDSTLGVDLGGTKLALAVVESDGRVSFSERIPTREAPAEVIEDIVTSARQAVQASASKVRALGIGVAGQIDDRTGTVRFAPNLEWRDVPLQAELEEQLGMPVLVTNDVRAATWGEWLHGAGRGTDDLVCVFVGTGIGGGIVVGGGMLQGCSNTAGEIGHLTVMAEGRECSCGGRGCMEAYAGGWAWAARAQEKMRQDPQAGRKLLEMAGSVDAVTAETVGEAYHAGSRLAAQIVDEAVTHLAAGLVTIVNGLNPCRIILGGGVIHGVPEMVGRVEKIVRRRSLGAAQVKLEIVPSQLMGEAGTVGAAAAARRWLQKEGS